MKRLGDDLVAIIKTPFPMLKSNLNSVQSFDLYGELLNADDALAHLSSMLPSFPATTLPFGFVVNRTNEEISRLLGGAE
ncbi:hypothetical protein RIdsm_04740 [Roseovarius indicus]|uniref:Uncharacterized protein n=2 Tax=Roseovarius indicus TaxID=540747 RepID=A0A0T5PES9_9RHOB|nr:hypothetical protein XM52_02640 [Roseovarius indicus]QEW28899.1 hypothetical protein RIdsm_04740 [Roseovarius indicus]SFD82885.1 hypothetical protein SAMN04488031_102762 [Roseovarius indicus]